MDEELLISKEEVETNFEKIDNLSDSNLIGKEDILTIPNTTYKKLNEVVKAIADNTSTLDNLSKVIAGYGLSFADLHDTLFKEKSDSFSNKAVLNKDGKQVKLHITDIKYDSGEDLEDLSMDDFDLAFNSALGVTTTVPIPLWHSGIWIAIDSPTETELSDLDLAIAQIEVSLGVNTAALVYSNHSVVYNGLILDFILKKINYTSVNVKTRAKLKELIKMTDVNALFLGLIISMFPDGLERMISCKNTYVPDEKNKDKMKCNHSFTSNLEPRNMLYVDYPSLTREQLYHMSKKHEGAMSIDDVIKYQNSLSYNEDIVKSYNIKNGKVINIGYKVPNIKEYIEQGELWILSIMQSIGKTFSQDIDDKLRNSKVNDYAKTNLLGGYLHFFRFLDFGKKITSPKEINDKLPKLSSVDYLFNEILNDITEYINKSSLAIVAIPAFKCPDCKEENNNPNVGEGEFGKELIPFNLSKTLFSLGTLKLMKIRERE